MKTSILLICALAILMLFSCKAQQYTIDDLPSKQLIFGRGGGITGEVNTYTLLENGQLFHNNSLTADYKELNSIDKKQAKSAFEKMATLKLSEIDFNHPGNMYYFIEEVDGDKKHRVTWGAHDYEVDATCEAFYKELRTTIKE